MRVAVSLSCSLFKPSLIRFSPCFSTESALDRVISNIKVPKFNNQFSVLICLKYKQHLMRLTIHSSFIHLFYFWLPEYCTLFPLLLTFYCSVLISFLCCFLLSSYFLKLECSLGILSKLIHLLVLSIYCLPS